MPAPARKGSVQGWEQTEEVAHRLLDDIAAQEARTKAMAERERQYGHLVAEAHRRGMSVERPWEQEEVRASPVPCVEGPHPHPLSPHVPSALLTTLSSLMSVCRCRLQEVYQRLHDELLRLEKEEKAEAAAKAPPVVRVGKPSGASHGAVGSPMAAGVAPRHSPHATDEPTEWQQEEEMAWRLADEMTAIEGKPPAADAPGGPKWIPKSGMVKHSASEQEMLQSPTWEQEQEWELHQRLHSEMLALETRADARLRGDTSGASLADDRLTYDQLQQQLRALEASGAGKMPPTDKAGLPRQLSRGSLLPLDVDSASGVHMKL